MNAQPPDTFSPKGKSGKPHKFERVQEADWVSIWEAGGIILFARVTSGAPEIVWADADSKMGERLHGMQQSKDLWDGWYEKRQASAIYVRRNADEKKRAAELADLKEQHPWR